MTEHAVGARIKRMEDQALLAGKGQFVDDIRLPDMAHAAFVRSPNSHAEIGAIDAAVARGIKGVHAVLTLADLMPWLTDERLPLGFPSKELPDGITPFVLAKDEVCYVGETVCVVIAESRYIAEDAASSIEIEFKPLPPVADCRAAAAPDSPLVRRDNGGNILTEFEQNYGDCETAFAQAAHVFGVSLKQHRGGPHSIEGRGVLARHDPVEDRMTVWSSTQMSHEIRSFLVQLLDTDEDHLRVIAPDVGGGFGGKYSLYAEEVVVAVAAKMLGRPVKWIEDRREHFIATIQERDQYWDMEVAVDEEGRLQGVRGTLIHDHGAYTPQGINLPFNASTAVPGPYVLPNYNIKVIVAETNKVPAMPVRGAGYPSGTFAMERLLDRVAAGLGLDRAEVRRRNLIPGDKMPYVTPLKTRAGSTITCDSGDFPLCQAKAMAALDYEGFPERQAAARADGHYLGIGLANGIKGTGRGPFESGLVRIGRSGKVSVYTGALAMGQGIKTSLAQVCADQLGVEVADITVVAGDTATIPLGLGGFASRQAVTAGSSVHLAAVAVREKVLAMASHMLEAAEQDLEITGGRVQVKGVPNLSVELRDIALAATGVPGYTMPGKIEPGLEAMMHFAPEALTYSNAVHAVEVEVDIETGQVAFHRYVVVSDSGRLINPMIVDGQIQGGVVHGIGNALFEWMGYDENAQPVTTTFAEYLLPTAPELPNIEIIYNESPTPLNPLGVKGVGESGTVPAAAAILSAVENALEPFGVRIDEAPISPVRIFELIEAGRRPSQ